MYLISVNTWQNSIENAENGDVHFLTFWELQGWKRNALINHRQLVRTDDILIMTVNWDNLGWYRGNTFKISGIRISASQANQHEINSRVQLLTVMHYLLFRMIYKGEWNHDLPAEIFKFKTSNNQISKL